MKGACLAVLMFCAAAGASEPKVSGSEAKALVMAVLTAQQRKLPNLEIIPDHTPLWPRFWYFAVTWKGPQRGSGVIGNYAVDPLTADVFSSTRECGEEMNRRLAALQAQVRRAIHLTQAKYERMRTRGPLCD